MGLVSMIPKTRVFNYAKRIANVTPEMMLGTGSDLIGEAARNTKGSLYTKAKAGFLALEEDLKLKKKTEGGFFKRLFNNLKSTPKDISTATKEGYNAAKAAGKNKIWGGIKGLKNGIVKKMPFIGAILTIAFELPNIWTATKEQGIGQGLKEVGKAGSRLAGGAIGAAIGSAICPGIGSLIGWIAGDWLTSKVVGKSYTEQKMDAELQAQELAQQQAQQTQQTAFTGNPYETEMTNPMYGYGYNDMSGNPYADDIMMQQLNFNTLA